MEGTGVQAEADLIEEELALLLQQDLAQGKRQQARESVWISHVVELDPFSDTNRHRFNHYADKQLEHLVMAELFEFQNIASILNYIFREERLRFSEKTCRERWHELYCLREKGAGVKEKRMEDKRATSVSAFSDPFSLYNLEEMLDKLQTTEHSKQTTLDSSSPASYQGYNIFKNSIRQITDLESHKQRQSEMFTALSQAKQQAITDKLMHFEPDYERLNDFEVKQEELTEQKMKEIMSKPIEIEGLEKELRIKDMNQEKESWKDRRCRREQDRIDEEEHQYDIQEDWDEYESD